MDYTIVYATIVLIIAVGLAFGVRYLKGKNIITDYNISFITEVLGVAGEFVIQLNPKNSDELKKISYILTITNKYIKDINRDIKKDEVMAYTIALCDRFKLTLTEDRKAILDRAVDALLSKVNLEKEINKTETVVDEKIESADPAIEDAISIEDINEEAVVESVGELGEDYIEANNQSDPVEESAKEITINTESTDEPVKKTKRKYTKKAKA